MDHSPLKSFKQSLCPSDEDADKAALIILNYKLHGLENLIRENWNNFSAVACADGGSSILYSSVDQGSGRYIPNFVCGDLDSASTRILEEYKSKGVSIVKCPDQDSTDFTKTLLHLVDLKKTGEIKFSSVYVCNGIGGRFDQTLANINTMFSVAVNVPLYLISEDSLVFVLEPGKHTIHVDLNDVEGHCGLIPLGESCSSCTTSGLEWNLDKHSMEIGGLISTNNLIKNETIIVENSHRLLWTMSHGLLKR